METEEKQLWANIQKAKVGQYSELRWPFSLAAYQDQRGVGSYIQGFLDAVAAEKRFYVWVNVPIFNMQILFI